MRQRHRSRWWEAAGEPEETDRPDLGLGEWEGEPETSESLSTRARQRPGRGTGGSGVCWVFNGCRL